MVGAGGIGCELLKNCVLAGIGDITIVRRVDSPRRADIGSSTSTRSTCPT